MGTLAGMGLRGGTLRVVRGGIVLGLIAGCESQGDPGEVDSGLPQGALLSDLSVEDVNALCRADVRAQNEAALEGDACQTFAFDEVTTAYLDGARDVPALQSDCTSLYDDCVSTGDSIAAVLAEDCHLTSLPPADCVATVGQLETCWTDQIEFLARPTPTCAEISVETLQWGVDRLTGKHNEAPPSCKIFYDKCPSGFPR